MRTIATLCKSHRHPYAVRSDPERNPIGRRTQSDRTADANGDVSTEIIILNLCDLELNDKAFDPKYIISTAEIKIARTRWLTILMLFLIIIALYLSAYLKFFCNFA